MKSKTKLIEIVTLWFFSILLSSSLVISLHIPDADFNSINFMNPFELSDIFLMLTISIAVFVICFLLYSLICGKINILSIKKVSKKLFRGIIKQDIIKPISDRKIESKFVAIGMLFSFLLFLPYLLTYFPGLLLGDSVGNLYDEFPLDNHHVVLFTIFVKACIKISSFFGYGTTGGVLLFSIIQMFIFAFGISYIFSWICSKLNIKDFVSIILTIIISVAPYIANYSIAMWKDPMFSVAVVMLTFQLTDIYFEIKQKKLVNVRNMVALSLLLFLILFLRNNGIFIVVFVLVALLVWYFYTLKSNNKDKASITKTILACILPLFVYAIIVGPIYNIFSIKQVKKVESYGPAVNTMAYVYLNNGNLDETDLEYLNTIIPLNDIQDNYSPIIVDKLKWSQNFNDDALKDGFINKFLKVFLQNPWLCTNSFLQLNFGFWSINHHNVWEYKDNIYYGSLRNLLETRPANDVLHNDIQFMNIFNSDEAYVLFPLDNHSIPISLINWLILFFIVCAILSKNYRIILFLTPVMALACTIIIASPIWYWPRYELTAQLLVPYMLFIIYVFHSKSDNVK